MSVDAQKFYETLRRVRPWDPTGVIETEILAMAVKAHVENGERMSYSQENFRQNKWMSLKIWDFCPHHSEWMEPSTGERGVSVAKSGITDDNAENDGDSRRPENVESSSSALKDSTHEIDRERA